MSKKNLKFVSFILAALCAIGFCSCGRNGGNAGPDYDDPTRQSVRKVRNYGQDYGRNGVSGTQRQPRASECNSR